MATPATSLAGTLGVVGGSLAVAVLVAMPFAARALSRPAAAWLRAE